MKKRVAVVMGGYSDEFEVSINSGNVVYENIDRKKFDVYKVVLSKENFIALADGNEYPINLRDFSFEKGEEKISFDVVFNAIHGSPGEDGPLAGYFELLGLPQTASGQFESALTFNKAECNILLSQFNIKSPNAVFIKEHHTINTTNIIDKVGLPCFVKPSRSGSSIGISKVKSKDELLQAIEKAKRIDHKVLIEGMVKGTELSCGVSNHTGKIKALTTTEIVPKNEFFDYESKYSGLSEEITPARVSTQVINEVKRITELIYAELGLNGLARADFIIDENQQAFLIEVNTVPGLSSESILPRQAKYLGISLNDLFTQSLEKALNS